MNHDNRLALELAIARSYGTEFKINEAIYDAEQQAIQQNRLCAACEKPLGSTGVNHVTDGIVLRLHYDCSEANKKIDRLLRATLGGHPGMAGR